MKNRIVYMLVALLSVFATIASADTYTLTKGVWKIGEDFPEGHYTISMGNYAVAMECDKVTEAGKLADDAQHAFVFLPTDKEYVFTSGYYLSVTYGSITLTSVDLTEEQRANETFMSLMQARYHAIKSMYNGQEEFITPLEIGAYTVGVDIPEGNWCIISWGNRPSIVTVQDESDTQSFTIYRYTSTEYRPGFLTNVYIPLRDGMRINVTNSTGKYGTGGVFLFPYKNE